VHQSFSLTPPSISPLFALFFAPMVHLLPCAFLSWLRFYFGYASYLLLAFSPSVVTEGEEATPYICACL
jgi:hypothetical protein